MISGTFVKGMNKLPTAKRVGILNILVEGMSMRSISRTVGVSINTVTKMLVGAGEAWLSPVQTARTVAPRITRPDVVTSFYRSSDDSRSVIKYSRS